MEEKRLIAIDAIAEMHLHNKDCDYDYVRVNGEFIDDLGLKISTKDWLKNNPTYVQLNSEKIVRKPYVKIIFREGREEILYFKNYTLACDCYATIERRMISPAHRYYEYVVKTML